VNCLGCDKPLPERKAGVPGRERKYCNQQCRPKPQRKLDRPSSCLHCQKPLTQTRAMGYPKRHCDQTCRSAKAAKKRKLENQTTRPCKQCGNDFLTTNQKQVYCNTECRLASGKEAAAIRSADYYKKLYPDGIKRKPCGWCGETLEVLAQKSLSQRRYHEECSIEAQRARYRIKTVKRQSKLTKPSRLAADQVLREYGSTCHICKEPIDLDLPRTSRMGLTVDHVFPLSKGGSDELDNLRPAHWICNNRKSDKVDAQSW